MDVKGGVLGSGQDDGGGVEDGGGEGDAEFAAFKSFGGDGLETGEEDFCEVARGFGEVGGGREEGGE